MVPIINQLAEEFYRLMRFYSIEFDDAMEIRRLFGIEKAPCFLYVINGEVKELIIGLISRKELTEVIRKFLH